MNRKTGVLLGGAALLFILFVAGGGFLSEEPDGRMEQLQKLSLPADGLALYQTLLEEIPDVVSQIPCACCGEALSWCYEGGCPPS